VECAGELISKGAAGQKTVDSIENIFKGEENPAAEANPQVKYSRANAPEYIKRDCGLFRSLKQHYASWLEDLDKFYLRTAHNYPLDKEESTRIATEIIDKARAEKRDLVGLMEKGKKKAYLSLHGVNVAVFAAMIGTGLAMADQSLLHFVLGCLYIDIGMAHVPEQVFTKEAKLNTDEIRKVQAHPVHGYQILVQQNGFPSEVGLVVLEHHERTDGRGYPRKLSANGISVFGRIAAIVDTYAAMISKRSYRSEYAPHEAIRNVLASGQEKYDKQYLVPFVREIGVYPVGTYVRLNNNAVAVVTAADPSAPARPELKHIFDEFGDPVNRTEIIRLALEKDLAITRAFNEKEKLALQQSKIA
jgi:HD-GYP domain-containing protein (c-di-GMP phosphodiesterase class II)